MQSQSVELGRVALLGSLLFATPNLAAADGAPPASESREWKVILARGCTDAYSDQVIVRARTYTACGAVFDRSSHRFLRNAPETTSDEGGGETSDVESPDGRLRASVVDDGESFAVQVASNGRNDGRVVATISVSLPPERLAWLDSHSLLAANGSGYTVIQEDGVARTPAGGWTAPSDVSAYARAVLNDNTWSITNRNGDEVASYGMHPDDVAFFMPSAEEIEEVRVSRSDALEFAGRRSIQDWAQSVLARYAYGGHDRNAVAFVRDGKRTLRASWVSGECVSFGHTLEVTEDGPSLIRVHIASESALEPGEWNAFLREVPAHATRIRWADGPSHDRSIED